MSLQVEKLEHNMAKLTVEVAAEDVEKALQAAYLKQRKQINIPGFRKGKVPRQMIEKMYGPEVFYDEAANNMIPDAYAKAYDESELDIVSQPKIEVVQMEKGKPFIFTAEVATKPEVTLGDYKGLKVDKVSTRVTQKEVDEEIEKERERNARTIEVTDRAVQDKDEVTLDFEGFVDGVAFEGGKGENYPLEIGSGSFIPGFEDQVIGMTVDKEQDIVVTFPEDYGAADLAGKEATFKVTVHEIKEKHLPEIDDELAKDVNIDGVETLDQLKDHIKANIKTRKESENENKFMDDLYKAIVASSKVEDSDALLEQEQGLMLQEIEQNLQRQGLNFEVYQQFTGKSKDDIKEDIKPQAEERVKLNAILAAIIEEEKLAVSDEELETELKTIAEYYQKELDEVKKIFEGNMSRIENDLLTRKAVDLVKDNLK